MQLPTSNSGQKYGYLEITCQIGRQYAYYVMERVKGKDLAFHD
jgi:hypothetical protein